MVLQQAEQANGHQNGHKNGEQGYTGFKDMNFMGTRVDNPRRPESDSSGSSEYSAFPHKQSELLRTLYGVIMEGNIDDRAHQQLLLRLFRIFEREWSAPVCNRNGLIARYETWAAEWQKQFASEPVRTENTYGKPIPSVDELLSSWNTNANLLAEAYVYKRKHGLNALRAQLLVVDEEETEVDGRTVVRAVRETARDQLDAARKQIDDVRFGAAALPPARQQYFWCKVQAYKLSIERNIDLALDRPVADYTDVKQALAKGLNIHLAIWDMPWAYKELYARVFGSMADGKTMRDYLTTIQIQQWPYDRRPPRPKGRGLLGLMGRGDEEEEEEEDFDDRNAADRRQDQKKDQDRKKGKR